MKSREKGIAFLIKRIILNFPCRWQWQGVDFEGAQVLLLTYQAAELLVSH
jgi:hypothetical protein